MMTAILSHLGIQTPTRPTLATLDALVSTYVCRIPWESASRIVQRSSGTGYPRWPEAFWQSAIRHGTGGTCFESNYAFFWLLRELGYTGYLTINNMRDSVGCHTAIVVTLEGQPYLVDVGLPVHLPVPLHPQQRTERETPYHTYSATPQDDGHYLIERDRHPRRDCFTLVNRPVEDAAYRAATTADYGADGLFLDEVIVSRVVGGRVWRFHAEGPPYHLERFQDGDKTFYWLGYDPQQVAARVAQRFEIRAEIIHRALLLT